MKKNKSLIEVQNTVEKYDGDKQKLIRELKRLIREGQKAGDVLQVGAAYYYVAIAHYDLGEPDELITNAIKAAELLKDTDAHELLAKAYIALAYAYGEHENHQMALAAGEKAHEIVKRHRIRGRTKLIALNNLASCYHSVGECKTSIRLLNECITQIETDTPEDYSNLLMFTLNLADSCQDAGETEKAGELLARVAPWLEKADEDPMVCDYFLRRASVSYKLGDTQTGDRFVDEALARIPQDVYPLPLYDDLRSVSEELLARGDLAREARIFAWITAYADKVESTLEKLVAVRAMANHYKGVGETDRAMAYFMQADELHEERARDLTRMQLNVYRQQQEADAEIRSLKKKMRKNEEMISLEPMTKLLNRSALLKAASEFIEAAKKRKQKVGAIFLDIDFFKECNDTYGHARGDEIIRAVARVCKKEESANVRFARYGGDEFFGLTRGLSDEAVLEIARRICRRIREADLPNEKNPQGGRITLSVGVANAAITDRTDTIIEIANFADKALYHAKNTGKNAIWLLDYDESDKKAEFVRVEF